MGTLLGSKWLYAVLISIGLLLYVSTKDSVENDISDNTLSAQIDDAQQFDKGDLLNSGYGKTIVVSSSLNNAMPQEADTEVDNTEVVSIGVNLNADDMGFERSDDSGEVINIGPTISADDYDVFDDEGGEVIVIGPSLDADTESEYGSEFYTEVNQVGESLDADDLNASESNGNAVVNIGEYMDVDNELFYEVGSGDEVIDIGPPLDVDDNY